jgi:hypothetical protein
VRWLVSGIMMQRWCTVHGTCGWRKWEAVRRLAACRDAALSRQVARRTSSLQMMPLAEAYALRCSPQYSSHLSSSNSLVGVAGRGAWHAPRCEFYSHPAICANTYNPMCRVKKL